ncbi:unnamed protein product [Amoebophrya sp. A120]|nr:unnamed protein product [Amoebophrya sp. A120]|eukprot:GSA120T00010602001.1
MPVPMDSATSSRSSGKAGLVDAKDDLFNHVTNFLAHPKQQAPAFMPRSLLPEGDASPSSSSDSMSDLDADMQGSEDSDSGSSVDTSDSEYNSKNLSPVTRMRKVLQKCSSHDVTNTTSNSRKKSAAKNKALALSVISKLLAKYAGTAATEARSSSAEIGAQEDTNMVVDNEKTATSSSFNNSSGASKQEEKSIGKATSSSSSAATTPSTTTSLSAQQSTTPSMQNGKNAATLKTTSNSTSAGVQPQNSSKNTTTTMTTSIASSLGKVCAKYPDAVGLFLEHLLVKNCEAVVPGAGGCTGTGTTASTFLHGTRTTGTSSATNTSAAASPLSTGSTSGGTSSSKIVDAASINAFFCVDELEERAQQLSSSTSTTGGGISTITSVRGAGGSSFAGPSSSTTAARIASSTTSTHQNYNFGTATASTTVSVSTNKRQFVPDETGEEDALMSGSTPTGAAGRTTGAEQNTQFHQYATKKAAAGQNQSSPSRPTNGNAVVSNFLPSSRNKT